MADPLISDPPRSPVEGAPEASRLEEDAAASLRGERTPPKPEAPPKVQKQMKSFGGGQSLDVTYTSQTQVDRDSENEAWLMQQVREAGTKRPDAATSKPPGSADGPKPGGTKVPASPKPETPGAASTGAKAGMEALTGGAGNIVKGLSELIYLGGYPEFKDAGPGYRAAVVWKKKVEAGKKIFDGLVETILSPAIAVGTGAQQAAKNVAPSIESVPILDPQLSGFVRMLLGGGTPTTTEKPQAEQEAASAGMTVGDVLNLGITLGLPVVAGRAAVRRRGAKGEAPTPDPAMEAERPRLALPPGAYESGPSPLDPNYRRNTLFIRSPEKVLVEQQLQDAIASRVEKQAGERGGPPLNIKAEPIEAIPKVLDAQGRPIPVEEMPIADAMAQREKLRSFYRTKIDEPARVSDQPPTKIDPESPMGKQMGKIDKEVETELTALDNQINKEIKTSVQTVLDKKLGPEAGAIDINMLTLGLGRLIERGVSKMGKGQFEKWIRAETSILDPAKVATRIPETKVLDDDGVPKRMYHGTKYNFEQFKEERIQRKGLLFGKGFYFTDNPTIANRYAMDRHDRAGANVRPVYLDIKNPFDARKMYSLDEVNKILDQYPDQAELPKKWRSRSHRSIPDEVVTRLVEHEKKLQSRLLETNDLIYPTTEMESIKSTAVLSAIDDWHQATKDYDAIPGALTSMTGKDYELGMGVYRRLNRTIDRLKALLLTDPELKQQLRDLESRLPVGSRIEEPAVPWVGSKQIKFNVAPPELMARLSEMLAETPTLLNSLNDIIEQFPNKKSLKAGMPYVTEMMNETPKKDLISQSVQASSRYRSLLGLVGDVRNAAVKYSKEGSTPIIKGEELLDFFSKNRDKANQMLRKAGFDGIRHEGGAATHQKLRHDVWIAFDPKQVIPAFDLARNPQTIQEIAKKLSAALGDERGSIRIEQLVPGLGKAITKFQPNFAKMDISRAVKGAIRIINRVQQERIEEHTRGTRTFKETSEAALGLLKSGEVSAEKILQYGEGTTLNAEQMTAARHVEMSSAEALYRLARQVKAENPNIPEGTLRGHVAVQAGLGRNVLGVKAEGGRAMESLRHKVGPDPASPILPEQLREFAETVRPDLTEAELADMILRLKSPDRIRRWAAGIGKVPGVLEELSYGVRLSNPLTHSRNVLSAAVTPFMAVTERFVGEFAHHLVNNPLLPNAKTGVVHGEALAMTHGGIRAIRSAWLVAREMAKGELEPVFGPSIFDSPREAAITAKNFGMEASPIASTIDWLGKIIRSPSRALVAEDAFAKVIHFEMERAAQTVRTAMREGLQGQALTNRIAELDRNPTEAILRHSLEASKTGTFTKEFESNWMRSLQGVTNPTLMRVTITPFFRTPMRIAEYANDRTPGLNLLSSAIREDIATGGARRDLAVAKTMTGAALIGTFMYAANSNLITGNGPKDPQLRKMWELRGWRPKSIYNPTNKTYYSYDGLEPISSIMGFSADIASFADSIPEVGMGEAVSALILSQWQNLASKNFAETMADVVGALEDPNTEKALNVIRKNLAQWVPGAVSAARGQVDDTMREVNSIVDAWKDRIPGLSSTLPPRRNPMTGEKIIRSQAPLSLINPFFESVDSKDPVMSEVVRNRIKLIPPDDVLAGNPPPGGLATMSPERATVGVKLSPQEYDRLIVLGATSKNDGKTLHQALTEMVKSPEYRRSSDGPDGGKALRIQLMFHAYYQMAELKLMEENPKIRRAVEDRMRLKLESLRQNQPGIPTEMPLGITP
jgi:hypothetical protein